MNSGPSTLEKKNVAKYVRMDRKKYVAKHATIALDAWSPFVNSTQKLITFVSHAWHKTLQDLNNL